MNEPTVKTDVQLLEVLKEITFKNTVLDFKWRFEFEKVIIGKPRSPYESGLMAGSQREGWLLWVSFERPDTITGEIGRGRGRDEIVWRGATVSAVVKTAWVLVELMVRHELMEGFRWEDARIFNPHNSVYALAGLQKVHDEEINVAKKTKKG